MISFSDGTGPRHSVVAVVLAGGSGSRFAAAMPKQLTMLDDAPVIGHVFRTIDAHPLIDRAVVSAHPDWAVEISERAQESLRQTPWSVVTGGDTRNDSVVAAVNSLDLREAVIVVNDGARPLVTQTLITECIAAMAHADAVLPVTRIPDPIVAVDSAGQLQRFVARGRLVAGQTPQVFWLSTLLAGLSALDERERRACSTIYEALLLSRPDLNIRLVPGDPHNIKLTFPADGHLLAQLLRAAKDA